LALKGEHFPYLLFFYVQFRKIRVIWRGRHLAVVGMQTLPDLRDSYIQMV